MQDISVSQTNSNAAQGRDVQPAISPSQAFDQDLADQTRPGLDWEGWDRLLAAPFLGQQSAA